MTTVWPDRQRRRLHAVGVLLLHLLVVVVGPIVHGPTSAHPGATPHIEARSDGECPPAHDHSHCQICRAFAWSATLPGTGGVMAAAPHATARPPLAGTRLAAAPAAHSPHSPRAPPRA
jgi:hypothetical protein